MPSKTGLLTKHIYSATLRNITLDSRGNHQPRSSNHCVWPVAGAFELYNNKGRLCRLPLYRGDALSLCKLGTRGNRQQAMTRRAPVALPRESAARGSATKFQSESLPISKQCNGTDPSHWRWPWVQRCVERRCGATTRGSS